MSLERDCQTHRYLVGAREEEAKATVDGKTRPAVGMGGKWAYMCDECVEVFGYPDSQMNTKLAEVN